MPATSLSAAASTIASVRRWLGLEGKIAFEALLERFGDIGFGTRTPEYKPNIVLRGLKHLDIRVERASAKPITTTTAEAAAD